MELNATIQSICVYCGCSDRVEGPYLEAARDLGTLLATQGICLVYGAGKTGLMGALADGALAAGGQVIGVTPENLNTPQLIHASLSRLEVTPGIQQRKARMSELSDAFIALPGGFGTLDELFETLTWAQIGIHQKPIGLLNTADYFAPLLTMVRAAAQHGFIYPEHQNLLMCSQDAPTLLKEMSAYRPPIGLDRWVNRDAEN